jgi:hypothetical protein
MTEYYKGARIEDLLQIIAEMEARLNNLLEGEDYSLAQYEEVAQGYTSLALAKAKLTALQGEN